MKEPASKCNHTDSALKESEQIFRTIFENASDGILLADNESKKIFMGNKQIYKALGYGPEEIKTLGVTDIHPEEDLPYILAQFEKLIRNEIAVAKDIPVKRKDGSVYYADIWALPIPLIDKTLTIGIFRDITERKRAEEELREAEKWYHALFEGANDAIFIVREHRFIECNQMALNMYGFEKKEEIIDYTPWELSPHNQPDGRESKGKALEFFKTALEGTPQRFYWKHLRKDGTPFDAEVSLSRINLEDQVFIQGIVRDITERKRTEEALEKRIMALTRPLESSTDIAFEELFNLDDIQQLQDEFAQATGVASIITHTDGTPITAPSSFCRLCIDIIRKTDKGLANCYKSDSVLGRYSVQGPSIQLCMSGGLWDAGAGISVGGRHIANWLIGQVRDKTQTEEKMRQYAREIDADEQAVVEAFREVPAMSLEQFERVSQVLFTLANQLSNIAYQNVQQARFILEHRQAEEALREKSQFIASLLHAIPVAVFYKDNMGRYLGCNDAFTEIMGVTAEQISGKTVQELWPSELAEKYHQMDLELMRNREHQVYEFQVKAKDGQMHPVIYAKDVFLDKEGEVAGLVGAFLDITERKQAEEALRESEEKYRRILDTANEGIWMLDADLQTIFVNARLSEIIGYQVEEIIGSRFDAFLFEEDLPDHEMRIEARKQGMAGRYERRLRHKDGHAVWTLISASPIFDSKRHFQGAMAMLMDITERKRIEEALQENLDILAEAERIGHTGSWKRDLATNQTFWSAETRRIFGLSENEEVLFETLKSRIHPEDRGDMLDKLQETVNNGIPFNAEYRIVLPDGTTRYIYDKGEATLNMEGKPVIIHGFVSDITERKRLEDDLIKAQKLDSIGTLAGGIAHDYNNLLSVIMGNIDLAKMLITRNDQTYAVLTKAEQAALKARDLTQQIITFSRGGYPLSKIIDIRDCLTQAARLALSGSNIRPEWNIAEDLPEVRVDENQIRLVIQNIVINAREAMPRGGTLFIDINKALLKPDNILLLPEGTYIRLTFRDEGSGIPAEILPKVFDPYFTTKAKGATKGMGLGLSICYSIIKRHMGHIMLESKEGVGTTVIIHLPAAMVHIEL